MLILYTIDSVFLVIFKLWRLILTSLENDVSNFFVLEQFFSG